MIIAFKNQSNRTTFKEIDYKSHKLDNLPKFDVASMSNFSIGLSVISYNVQLKYTSKTILCIYHCIFIYWDCQVTLLPCYDYCRDTVINCMSM